MKVVQASVLALALVLVLVLVLALVPSQDRVPAAWTLAVAVGSPVATAAVCAVAACAVAATAAATVGAAARVGLCVSAATAAWGWETKLARSASTCRRTKRGLCRYVPRAG